MMRSVLLTLVWSAVTIAIYFVSKAFYNRHRSWWNTPLAVTPTVLVVLVLAVHASYSEYITGTRWMIALLGPATVAFAVPIYEQRALIRKHWGALLVGTVVGSAMISAWLFASLLGVQGELRLSLLPRSFSTPFAMAVSGDIGGSPDLTAVFVVFTGVLGAIIGEALLRWLPLRSSMARGALLGMGAHGAGVATATKVGSEEGAVAGLIMVLVGVFNVLVAPVVAMALH
jgi:predicted murein hydrolase (TIGR00659 family)